MKGGNEYREGKAGNSDIRPYDSEECKAKYERSKRGIIREDLNLTGNDTDTEIVPRITCSRTTRIQHNELSREAQAAIDAREIAELDAQLECFGIHDNITPKRPHRKNHCRAESNNALPP